MDFKKFLPKSQDADEKTYFWSLIIEPGWVQAGIWRIEEKKAQIVLYSPPFSWQVEEELVQAVDDALSSAIQGFPEDIVEPTKTVFGVPSSWVTEGQISNEYIAKIKKLCSELSLTPIGFVVLPEAIAHLVKSEEGSPLNAVVLGVYKDNLEITLFRLGNLLGTTQVSRSVSVVDDVAEGLTRFGEKDPVPSRILIYDGREGELEEVRQSLLKVNWEDYENLRFLHTPKVEIIDVKEKIFAVSLAGASELASVTSVEIVNNLHQPGLQEEVEAPPSEETEISQEEYTPEDLGFALEKDITEQKEGSELPPEADTPIEAENIPAEAVSQETFVDDVHKNVEPVGDVGEALQKSRKGLPIALFVAGFFENVTQKVRSLNFPKKPRMRIFGGGAGNKPIVAGIAFFVILLLAGIALWWFYPKSTVTIYVSPKRLEEKFEVTVDTSVNSSDFSSKVLAGETIETTVKGDKTKDATGTKTVGEKAKGEVTLYRVGTQVTLSTGTLLSGPGDLKFTLDEEVVVASGSAGSPGTTKAQVVAEDIGAEYNLAGGSTFRVGNYTATDMEAKNESAFSGGTSREITAVSSDDQKVLEEDLTDELTENARGELLEKVTEEQLLVDGSVTATTSSRTFSNKVGDEADTLQLSLDVKASAVTITKSEVIDMAKEALAQKVPDGFVLRGEQIEFEFELKDAKRDEYEFDVMVSANLLPEINTEEIVQKIKGKYPSVADEYLNREVPGFVRAEIKIKPILPEKLKTLPHVAKNIDVEVAAER